MKLQLIPYKRTELNEGEAGKLAQFFFEVLWLVLPLCLFQFIYWWKRGFICLGTFGLVTLISFIRECIGDHVFQIKVYGESNWTPHRKRIVPVEVD